jgi:hypothetical protein
MSNLCICGLKHFEHTVEQHNAAYAVVLQESRNRGGQTVDEVIDARLRLIEGRDDLAALKLIVSSTLPSHRKALAAKRLIGQEAVELRESGRGKKPRLKNFVQ